MKSENHEYDRLMNELLRAKIRSTNAIAEKNEIKNKILTGEYISREEAAKKWQNAVLDVRNKFLGLSVWIAPQMVGVKTEREAEAIISETVKNFLNDLAQTLPND